MHTQPGSPLTSAEVAALVGGEMVGEAKTIKGVSSLALADVTQAAFLVANPTEGQKLEAAQSQAGLLLVGQAMPELERPLVEVENPALAAALLTQHFCPSTVQPGVHAQAVVDESAQLGKGVCVQANCVIGAQVVVGEGTVLKAGVVLMDGVQLGKGCVIEANAVIGADGFGYVWSGEAHEKVPQQGSVVIGDGVHMGACSTIDRGTFGDTLIGDGCILDNQVQVGHNCVLGKFVVLCAQVGLSGSTTLEDGVVFGGKASTTGHLTIGAGAQVAGAAVVTKDISAGAKVAGHPAWDIRKELKAQARLRKDL